MKVTKLVAKSMRQNTAHPTDVLNALIDLENAGGMSAVCELEYRLTRLAEVTSQHIGYGQPLITDAWLSATRAYLETYLR